MYIPNGSMFELMGLVAVTQTIHSTLPSMFTTRMAASGTSRMMTGL